MTLAVVVMLTVPGHQAAPHSHHHVGDNALKTFAQGVSELTYHYDGETRKSSETKQFYMHARVLPRKRGNIVDDKFIPFKKE